MKLAIAFLFNISYDKTQEIEKAHSRSGTGWCRSVHWEQKLKSRILLDHLIQVRQSHCPWATYNL